MRRRWIMLTVGYADRNLPNLARGDLYSLDSFFLKIENQPGPECKGTFSVEIEIYDVEAEIELPKPIFNFEFTMVRW